MENLQRAQPEAPPRRRRGAPTAQDEKTAMEMATWEVAKEGGVK